MFGEGSAYERGMVNCLFPTAISIAVLAAFDRKGITIVISGIHTQPYLLLEKTGMADKLGRENIYDNINSALNRAREIIGTEAKSKDSGSSPE